MPCVLAHRDMIPCELAREVQRALRGRASSMTERDFEVTGRTASHVWTTGDPSAGLRVIALWDGHVVERELVPGTELIVGRAHECSLRIDHKSVSRTHVRIVVGESVELEDLGSANGTHIGTQALPKGARVPLEPGALVSVGVATLVIRAAGASARPTGATSPGSERSPWPRGGVMDRVAELLTLVAQSDISVLFLGETGVGKQIAAQALHRASPRATGPFVSVNCAALPEALLESELFGHERGAFTGAVETKVGLAESASGGTLFLDEVGEMPLGTQAKLLHLLESGQLRRLGGVRAKQVDVRFVSATNRALPARVEEGEFRRDLFYRLAGMPIELPPLRERRSEVLPLARQLLAEAAARTARPAPELSDAACALLMRHPFPGNVRELRNAVERALVLSRGGAVEPEHLMLEQVPSAAAEPATDLRSAMRALEKQQILDALERAGGNQTRAAALLGIGRRTLIDKLEAHGIAGPRARRS